MTDNKSSGGAPDANGPAKENMAKADSAPPEIETKSDDALKTEQVLIIDEEAEEIPSPQKEEPTETKTDDAALATEPALIVDEEAVEIPSPLKGEPAVAVPSPTPDVLPLQDVKSMTASASGASISRMAAEEQISKTIVEHHVVTEPQAKKKGITSRFLGPIFGLSKPMVGAVVVYSVFATGAWAFLLPNYLALQEQVKELETQVDRLEVAVTDLEAQVDRYEEENEKLEENLEEFAKQNQQLQVSNALYQKLTNRLNNTVQELENQNEILHQSNEEYARLNDELNATAMALEDEVIVLEVAIDDIGETVLEAARINDEFLDEAAVLKGLNGTIDEQVEAINGVIIDMNSEIARLSGLVDELRTILAFLDEAANEIGESFEEISAFLAEQIEINETLLMETLQNTYQQSANAWVCSFQSFFAGDPFVENPDSPIGVDSYADVLLYVENNVLIPLCLDVGDFEAFLAADNGLPTPPVDVTVNQLISSISEYTTAALNYYFPDEGEPGLTNEDWADAGYQCNGLPAELKFTISAT